MWVMRPIVIVSTFIINKKIQKKSTTTSVCVIMHERLLYHDQRSCAIRKWLNLLAYELENQIRLHSQGLISQY